MSLANAQWNISMINPQVIKKESTFQSLTSINGLKVKTRRRTGPRAHQFLRDQNQKKKN